VRTLARLVPRCDPALSSRKKKPPLQDAKDSDSFSAPKHTGRNRALCDSGEILNDLGTIAHRLSHRRSERGTAGEIEEQTKKRGSEMGHAGLTTGVLRESVKVEKQFFMREDS